MKNPLPPTRVCVVVDYVEMQISNIANIYKNTKVRETEFACSYGA